MLKMEHERNMTWLLRYVRIFVAVGKVEVSIWSLNVFSERFGLF